MSFVEIVLKEIAAPNGITGPSNGVPNLIFYKVTFCLRVCLVCFANNRSIPFLLSTNFSERPD